MEYLFAGGMMEKEDWKSIIQRIQTNILTEERIKQFYKVQLTEEQRENLSAFYLKTQKSELYDWLENNTKGRYFYEPPSVFLGSKELFFELEEDLVLFKMIWQ